jgi:hypothetical protein
MSYDAFGGGGSNFAGSRLLWLIFWVACLFLGITVAALAKAGL